MPESTAEVSAFDASVALQSLSGGKPPPQHCPVNFFFGREQELALLERDLETVRVGYSTMRFLVGDLGAGKTALMNEHMRQARGRRFVTIQAEFSRDCLLHGRSGEGRRLLEHALLDMKTLGSSSGGAMDAIIGGFRSDCERISGETGVPLQVVHRQQLAPLEAMPRGDDFARVIEIYSYALAASDDGALRRARRWLCATFESNVESRAEIRLSAIQDMDVWCFIKLWARFVRLAGRPGLLLVLDEARLLSELLVGPTRAKNFAQLSRIYSEVLTGQVSGLGLLVASTPTFVSDTSNGLCSEPGLSSCLNRGQSVGGSADLLESVAFRLPELTYDNMILLLTSLRDLVLRKHADVRSMSETDIPVFIEQCRDRLGGQNYPHPRPLIQQFLNVHVRLAENPALAWADVLRAHVGNGASVASLAASSGQFAERSM